MQKELVLAIATGIIGTVAAYILCGFLTGDIDSTSVSTVDSNIGTDLATPDPEIFNYRALNPTVEVYVGSCAEYDPATGECIDQLTADELQELVDDGGVLYDPDIDTENNSTENSNSSNNSTNNSNNNNSTNNTQRSTDGSSN